VLKQLRLTKQNTELRIEDPILNLVTMVLVLVLVSCVDFISFHDCIFTTFSVRSVKIPFKTCTVFKSCTVFRVSSPLKFHFASKFYLP